MNRPLAPTLLFCFIACSISACAKDAGPAESTGEGPAVEQQQPPPAPALTQDQLAELYMASKARFEASEQLPEDSFAAIEADLMRVANEAEDAHLRANASLLLGGMHEAIDDQRAAVSFYRQAKELIPDEAAPHIVLALALAKDQKWDQAIAEQWKVVEMIPDDLVGWLLLGEFHVKGGKLDEAAEVYAGYELRRMGLLDGLTRKKDGEYVEDEAERAACAEALAPAVDNGTALALLFALDSDPSPVVRERVASIMGEQRLTGYEKLLETKLGTEADATVKEAIQWALAEIERDPVETAPGPVPEEIAKQVEAEAEALKKAAEAEAGAGAETGSEEGAEAPEAGEAGAEEPGVESGGEPGGEPGEG